MANEKHLSFLRQGVEVWNEWRQKNFEVEPDLSGAILRDADLKGINFCGANLCKIHLPGADLSKSNLQGANLDTAFLMEASLNSANLKYANLKNASLEWADLKKADFYGADFRWVPLEHAQIDEETILDKKWRLVCEIVTKGVINRDLKEVDLSESNLDGANLKNVNFHRANLAQARLLYANLEGANLEGANLEGASFCLAKLHGAILRKANLRDTSFCHANLSEADLSKTDLTGNNLRESVLWRADLRNTNLQSADLRWANLRAARIDDTTMLDAKWHLVWEIVTNGATQRNLEGADLSSANLIQTDFQHAILNRANFKGSDLHGSLFYNACLNDADLSFSNLEYAEFRHATLFKANLNKTDLKNVDLIDADLQGANLQEANLYNSCLVESNLTDANLEGAKLLAVRLQKAIILRANLKNANLSGADLSEATLKDSILEHAVLTKVHAFKTDFSGAKFTHAFLRGWNPDEAIFDNVICDFVYLKNEDQSFPANRKFEPGEFSTLFKAERSYSRLAVLEQLINRFERLLNEFPEGHESLFHDFLKENPILIDVYVSQKDIVSKPRFHYPPGESPLGKVYVEPDFVIKYSGNKYKLVELEKPGKPIATKQGQPTSGVNQAAFQIAEWDDYIRNHIDRIRDEYPGIANNRSYLVVIGRSNEQSIGVRRDPGRYMRLIASQYPCEVCSYDDLLDKAKQAHAALTALSF